MKIIVGSKNKVKIDAVSESLLDYDCMTNLEIVGIHANSGVSEQPLTLDETVQGAINRATEAFNAGGDYGFGIESGLMHVPRTQSGYMDMCICAIADKDDVYIGMSSAWEFPDSEVSKSIIYDGLDMSQACVKHGLTNDSDVGRKGGAINIVTNGRLNRKEYTKEAVRNAMIHIEYKLGTHIVKSGPKKDFKGWFKDKVGLHNSTIGEKILFNEREIWWCASGVNIGKEQDGKGARYARPVIVIKKHNMDTCLVAPLTTGGNESKYYYDVGIVSGKSAKVNLSQIRLVDRKRLLGKIGVLGSDIFKDLVSKLIQMNFPNFPDT